MGFPEDPTALRVGIGFGYGIGDDPVDDVVYTDVTDEVEPRVVIQRGRTGGSSIAPPTKIVLGIKNAGGDLSPDNILSPYYGLFRVNTPMRVEVDCGDGWVTRALGKIPGWSPRWSGPDMDRRLELEASGDDRRIGVSRNEVTSAITRQIRAPQRYDEDLAAVVDNVVPAVWWPMEDAAGATEAASGLQGGAPLVADGTPPEFGVSGMAGALSVAEFGAGGQLHLPGQMQVSSSDASWSLLFHVEPWVIPDASTQTLITVDGRVSVDVALTTSNLRMTVEAQVGGGSDFIDLPLDTVTEAGAVSVCLRIADSGANISIEAQLDGFGTLGTGTLVLSSFFVPTDIHLGPTSTPPDGTSMRLGQVAIYGTSDMVSTTVADGKVGENAGTRWFRLCVEEGLRYLEPTLTSQTMGAQLPATTAALLAECVSAQGGFQSEERSTGKFELYNFQDLTNNTLGYSSGSVTTSSGWLLDYDAVSVSRLEPERDDRDLFNRATVRIPGDEFASYEKTDGLRGSSTTTGAGLYADDSISRNVESVSQALHHASWLVNTLGTLDAPRFHIRVDLAASPELVSLGETYERWQQIDVGDSVWVVNAPPEEVGATVLDLVLDGYVEVIDGVEWTLDMWLSQRSPYNLLTVEGVAPTGHDLYDRLGYGNQARVAAGVSTLDFSYDDDQTSLSVTSESVRWIDSANFPTQFPLDVVIAGERIRVTAIAGVGLTQTFTVTRGMDGVAKPLPSGSTVQLFRPAVVAL